MIMCGGGGYCSGEEEKEQSEGQVTVTHFFFLCCFCDYFRKQNYLFIVIGDWNDNALWIAHRVFIHLMVTLRLIIRVHALPAQIGSVTGVFYIYLDTHENNNLFTPLLRLSKTPLTKLCVLSFNSFKVSKTGVKKKRKRKGKSCFTLESCLLAKLLLAKYGDFSLLLLLLVFFFIHF